MKKKALPIELIVFDFNGVIVADTQACKEADDEVIMHFGGTPPSLRQYRETVIIPAIQFYSLYGCNKHRLEASPDQMGQIFHGFYGPRTKNLRTRKGVRQVLSYLQANSIPAIILSNHTQKGVEAQLERLGLTRFFGAVLANQEDYTSMVERNKLRRLQSFLKEEAITLISALEPQPMVWVRIFLSFLARVIYFAF